MRYLFMLLFVVFLLPYPARAQRDETDCTTDELQLVAVTLADQLTTLAPDITDDTSLNELITAIVAAAQSTRELCGGIMRFTNEDAPGGIVGPVYMNGSIYTVTLKPNNATAYAQIKNIDGCPDFLPGIVADKIENSALLEINAGCTLIMEIDILPATATYELVIERLR